MNPSLATFHYPHRVVCRALQVEPRSLSAAYVSRDVSWDDPPFCEHCTSRADVMVEWWTDAEVLSYHAERFTCRECLPAVISDAKRDRYFDHTFGVVVTVSYRFMASMRKEAPWVIC